MSRAVDIAILGGGCAGLSLAYRMIGSGRDVTVIEPRASYTDDRAWSFWHMAPHPFDPCIIGRWSRWRVSASGNMAERSADGLSYVTVSAGKYYEMCSSAIQRSNDVNLILGTRAEIQDAHDDGVTLTLSGDTDTTLHAKHVIDTRPLDGTPRYGQWFVGHEVETEGNAFDPDVCDLMSFGDGRRGGIDFTYVLPFTNRRALVEATVFADTAPSEKRLADMLDTALSARTGGRHTVIRREGGMVPMDAAFTDASTPSRVTGFGVRGGAARPSTGYAYMRIQERAFNLAQRLRAGLSPDALQRDDQITQAMDRLFLNVLRHNPQRGPELFHRLFERASEHRLERFLSGSTAWSDRLAVMSALPTGLFLSHLVRP